MTKIEQDVLVHGGRAFRGSFVFWFLLFFALIALDQWVKHLAFVSGFARQLNLLRPVAGKELFKNFNFAFSLPVPAWLMYLVYFIILTAIARHIKNNFYKMRRTEMLGWVLIAAGACSNIFERIVLGYVKDFIFLSDGIFNPADFYILFGIALLLFIQFFKPKTAIYDS